MAKKRKVKAKVATRAVPAATVDAVLKDAAKYAKEHHIGPAQVSLIIEAGLAAAIGSDSAIAWRGR